MKKDSYEHPPMEKEQLLQTIECIKTICKTAIGEKMTECVAENSVQGGMNAVGEFHAACDAPVFDQEKPCQFPNDKDRELRMSLLKEEFEEYVEAEKENDIVAVADALADMLYIIFGTAHAYNIPLDEIFLEVHSTNMEKVGENGKVKRREDGKILKPEGWKPPQISKMIEEFNKDKRPNAANLLYEFRRKFVNRELAKQLDEVFETLKTVEVAEKLKEEILSDELVDNFANKRDKRSFTPEQLSELPPLFWPHPHPKDIIIGEQNRHLTMNGTGSVPLSEDKSEQSCGSLQARRDDDQWSWYDDSKEED